MSMTHDVRMDRGWAGIVASIALGAIAMYAFDPDKGRRRRALARDKAVSVLHDTRHAAGATRRDVTHRLEGLRARARRLWRQRPTTDDLQLIERVRARMGRLVTHPHAIQVGAYGGRVTLSGPILAREVAPLLASIRTVWGVDSVENQLVAHTHPESIPSLQGGVEPPSTHEHWPPALRAAALSSGVLLALYGLRQRTLTGWLLASIGAALGVRGVANRSLAAVGREYAQRRDVSPMRDRTSSNASAQTDTASDAAGADAGPRNAVH